MRANRFPTKSWRTAAKSRLKISRSSRLGESPLSSSRGRVPGSSVQIERATRHRLAPQHSQHESAPAPSPARLVGLARVILLLSLPESARLAPRSRLSRRLLCHGFAARDRKQHLALACRALLALGGFAGFRRCLAGLH